jgi:hypothetical protein
MDDNNIRDLDDAVENGNIENSVSRSAACIAYYRDFW